MARRVDGMRLGWCALRAFAALGALAIAVGADPVSMRSAAAQARALGLGAEIPITSGRTRLAVQRPPRQVHFVPNTFRFWDNPRFATTANPPKPAYADIVLEPTNFLPCVGGPFALCFYSGPSDGPEDLSCTLTEDGRFANCKCYEIAFGPYFVDINAILNYAVYLETIDECGTDGTKCLVPNSAPVCKHVNENTLIPGADLLSTFSFDCIPEEGIGQTSCGQSEPPYAGCMTAPCYRDHENPEIVTCSCPVFDGPYQVGLDGETCDLGGDLVWSAAYAPNGPTYPTPPSCVPDAPGSVGCPLFEEGVTPLPPGTDCDVICEAYACTIDGLEPGFTCDSVLCTDECNDRGLVAAGCGNLGKCPSSGTQAILELESEAGCSCCASQLCGCEPSAATNEAIFELNQAQRDLGITPQCDVNGTLCGTP